MPLNHFTDTTGTILNRYTMSESGQADKTVNLTFNPSDDYVAGTPYNASSMNPVIDQINANETALGGYSLWCGTQAEYDALTPVATTIYLIKES